MSAVQLTQAHLAELEWLREECTRTVRQQYAGDLTRSHAVAHLAFLSGRYLGDANAQAILAGALNEAHQGPDGGLDAMAHQVLAWAPSQDDVLGWLAMLCFFLCVVFPILTWLF